MAMFPVIRAPAPGAKAEALPLIRPAAVAGEIGGAGALPAGAGAGLLDREYSTAAAEVAAHFDD